MSGMKHPCCPYRKGKALEVQVKQSSSSSLKDAQILRLDVVRLFEPVTMSPAMLVYIPTTSEIVVAKFYDRRFNIECRENEDVDLWDGYKEKAYHEFVMAGVAKKYLEKLNDSETETSESTWSTAEVEAYFFDQCRDLYKNETNTYDALECFQGQNIPKLLAKISFQAYEAEDMEQAEYFEIRGVLLEYIDGFPLSDLAENTPSSAWQGIVDEALSIVNRAGDLGVMNRDLSPRHFIVRTLESSMGRVYQPVMIDFALSRQRHEFDTEEEWIEAKRSHGEEGAIGLVMWFRLGKNKDLFEYRAKYLYGVELEDGTIEFGPESKYRRLPYPIHK